MSKFLDILGECCKDGGECNCKKGKKCDNPSCKCKSKKVVKESFTSGAPCPKCGGKDFGVDKSEDGKLKCTKCGTLVKESKDEDEKGDWKFHNKKDDELGKDKPCSKCGSTKGYLNTKDGVKCMSCGKLVNESKFEKYIQEQQDLEEGVVTDAIKQAWGYVINKVEKLGVIFQEFPEALRLKTAGEIKKFLVANSPVIKKLVPGIVF